MSASPIPLEEDPVLTPVADTRKKTLRSGLVLAAVVLAVLAYFAGDQQVPLAWSTLLLIGVAFVCELIDSSLGMGYGTTLTPLLLLFGFDVLDLVQAVLVSELFTGLAAFFFHAEAGNVELTRKSRHLRDALLLSAFSIAGAAFGVNLAVGLSKMTLLRVVGVIVLSAGAVILVSARRRRNFRYSRWKLLGLGTIASFNKSISGGGYGPIMTSGQVLSGVEAKAAVAITSLAEATTCAAALATYLVRGEMTPMRILLPIVCGALLSVPFAARLVRRISEERMRVTIGVATLVLGLIVLVRALG